MQAGKYVISDTGEQVEVQKVECRKCHHYELHTLATAQKILDDWENYKCDLCFHEKGIHSLVRTYNQCSTCMQVFNPKQPYCYCPEKPTSTIRMVMDPKNAWTKKQTEQEKIQEEIENAKAKREYVDKMIARKHEDKNIQKEILSELKKLNNPKIEKVELKKINHEAIG